MPGLATGKNRANEGVALTEFCSINKPHQLYTSTQELKDFNRTRKWNSVLTMGIK